MSAPDQRSPFDELHSECERCAGLCCVAPAFSVSADFAVDKAPGHPCPNLDADFRCGIHGRLRDEGFPGCVAFECLGAGQQVIQVTYGGRDWRAHPEIATQQFEVFSIMRWLHEVRWYLTDAVTRTEAASLRGELLAALASTEELTAARADFLETMDPMEHGERVDHLLTEVSLRVRTAVRDEPVDHRGDDLMGADVRGGDLRAADLRGAYLIGADLRGADLTCADLIGADLRAAELGGADLTGSLFVTPAQVAGAKGDRDTKLSSWLGRPAHWPS